MVGLTISAALDGAQVASIVFHGWITRPPGWSRVVDLEVDAILRISINKLRYWAIRKNELCWEFQQLCFSLFQFRFDKFDQLNY